MADESVNDQDGLLPEPTGSESLKVMMHGSTGGAPGWRRLLPSALVSVGFHLFLLPFVLAITVTFSGQLLLPATSDFRTEREELGNASVNDLIWERDYPLEQIEELSVAVGSNNLEEDRTALSSDASSLDHDVAEKQPPMVGQIIIIGNTITRHSVILDQIPLYPGQLLTYPDLRVAERNLQRLNIFENDPKKGIHPTVEVLDPDGPNPVKDILVTVREAKTGSMLFGLLGVNSDAGLTSSIVLDERNFDILRFPTSLDDLFSGRAFRGAGQKLRVEFVLSSAGTVSVSISADYAIFQELVEEMLRVLYPNKL
jgi:outer membrane protein assembly factor BamA